MNRSTFHVKFDIDADAFDAGERAVIADVRISLRQVAEMVTRGEKNGTVLDANGDTIGTFGITSKRRSLAPQRVVSQ